MSISRPGRRRQAHQLPDHVRAQTLIVSLTLLCGDIMKTRLAYAEIVTFATLRNRDEGYSWD